jgi:hypothetical protein
MKEWFKKRVTFWNQNLLQEMLVNSQVDCNSFMRMEHSTFLKLFHMFVYQRLDSNWHMLCNVTTHNANELRNSRVAQEISEQFWFYATDCANCQLAPYTVNQLHNTQCCAHDWSWMGLLRETMRNLNQDNRSSGRDSKRASSKCEPRASPLRHLARSLSVRQDVL